MGKGIYKRGSIYWIRYAAPDGKIIRESTSTALKKEAEYVLACRRKEVKEGKTPEIKKIKDHSFIDLTTHYLEWAKRQKSFDTKKYFIKHLEKSFGNCPLASISIRMVEEYQTKGIASGKSAATNNRRLATLKHMFTKAVEWDMVDEETLTKVRRVKLLPENNKRLRYLAKEECQALKSASPT